MKKSFILLLSALLVIVAGCSSDGNDSEASADDGVVLERSYTSPNGKLSFSYPDGWLFDNIQNQSYIVADSQATLALVDSDIELTSGAQILFIGTLERAEDITFEAFVDEFMADTSTEEDVVSAIEETEIRGIVARKVSMTGPGSQTTIYALEAEPETVLLIGALYAIDEFDDVSELLDAFTQSVSYNTVLEAPGSPEREEESGAGSVDITPPLDLSYNEAIHLTDLIEGFQSMNTVGLSPDGSMLGWFQPDEGICLYTFEDNQTNCHPLSDRFRVRPLFIRWSPDSAYIAFYEHFIRTYHNPDIFLFDVAGGTFINATDDGVMDWRMGGNFDGIVWLDYLTLWGQDGNLYFIRTIDYGSEEATDETGIYRLNPQSGEVTLIRDITPYFDRLTLYDSQELYLDGPLSISPDGTQLAFLMRPGRRDDWDKMGIWLINLTDESEPTQLMSTYDLAPWYPEDADDDSIVEIPNAIAWSSDGNGIYLQTVQPFTLPYWYRGYYVDAASGEITVFFDLSSYTQADLRADLLAEPMETVFLFPSVMAMIPNTRQVLIGNRGRDTLGISSIDREGQQVLYYSFEEGILGPALTASASNDGKVLMFGYLFMPSDE